MKDILLKDPEGGNFHWFLHLGPAVSMSTTLIHRRHTTTGFLFANEELTLPTIRIPGRPFTGGHNGEVQQPQGCTQQR